MLYVRENSLAYCNTECRSLGHPFTLAPVLFALDINSVKIKCKMLEDEDMVIGLATLVDLIEMVGF